MNRVLPFFLLLGAACAPEEVAKAQPERTEIDLMTRTGTSAVGGEWEYLPIELQQVEAKNASGEIGKAWTIAPQPGTAGWQNAQWEKVSPVSLKDPRGAGKVCFAWYRISLTTPTEMQGKAAQFEVVVDDYAEVWVNGKLDRKLDQRGGSVVAGFNTPNTVVLTSSAKPGERFDIAVFGINGPISAAPDNYIFFRTARLLAR